MLPQPELKTERLLLRPFTLADAPTVQALAGDEAIASTTLHIPHPYEDGMAEKWIGSHAEMLEKDQQVTYAITLAENGVLIGAISLTIEGDHRRAEMGYWIGKPYWGRGYCTEAAGALLDFGFAALELNKIFATHLSRNPASGRVMQKAGMQHEGHLRQHVKKWDRFEDLECYAILRVEHGVRRQ